MKSIMRSLTLALMLGCAQSAVASTAQPTLGTRTTPILTRDGLRFRDLNRDGEVNAYEDWRLSPDTRVADLIARMTLREKAGTMMHGNLPGVGPSGAIGFSTQGYALPQAGELISGQAITSFITRIAVSPSIMAEQNNVVQSIAEQGRLGIPLTISTDPRNHFQYIEGASATANGFSQWPEPLGFAALRDPERVRRFADIVRREYRATGIHQALSPQADLATEPRWSRGTATFGSSPDLAQQLVKSYVSGFQGDDRQLSQDGVMAVVKHWVGYGATPEGWDGHNYYGRFARADNASFALHVKPFIGAFEAQVSAVMPTYSIIEGVQIDGKPLEPVGAGFSKPLLAGLLRRTYGFDGIILSDWAILEDCPADTCRDPKQSDPPVIGMPWGVDGLTRQQRIVKGVDAGVDQFGGAHYTDLLVDAARKGMIDKARIDESVRRILLPKFTMGLFENPYVDVADAAAITSPAILAEGVKTQAESQVLLKAEGGLKPIAAGQAVYLIGVDPARARAYGLVVVDDPAQASAAIVRMSAPSEMLHPFHFFGGRQNEGRLDYRDGDADFERLKALRGRTRIIASIFLDRPAVLTNIVELTDVLFGNFGISDDALLDVVTGRATAQGRMPFELPSSMAAVEAQDSARPDDSAAPLFAFGAGITTVVPGSHPHDLGSVQQRSAGTDARGVPGDAQSACCDKTLD